MFIATRARGWEARAIRSHVAVHRPRERAGRAGVASMRPEPQWDPPRRIARICGLCDRRPGRVASPRWKICVVERRERDEAQELAARNGSEYRSPQRSWGSDRLRVRRGPRRSPPRALARRGIPWRITVPFQLEAEDHEHEGSGSRTENGARQPKSASRARRRPISAPRVNRSRKPNQGRTSGESSRPSASCASVSTALRLPTAERDLSSAA